MTDWTAHDTVVFAIRDNFKHLWAEADDIAEVVLTALRGGDYIAPVEEP